MTATVASDCKSMTITSTFFNVYNTYGVLKVTYNSNTTTINLTPSILSYTLTPAALNMDTTFLDGVYTLTLITTSVSGVKTTESLCRVSLCGIKCSILDSYAEADYSKALAYEALKVANDCIQCDCTILTKLFNILTNTPTDDCNCGSNSL